MFLRFLSLFTILIVCLSCSPYSKTKTQPENAMTTTLDTYFEALTQLKQFNGAVLIQKNDTTLLRKAYTFTQDSSHSLYITLDHQFDLRSVAKLFAKLSILQLEQDGKLNRSDLLSQYLPDFPRAKEITIQQLLDHQAGFPREFKNYTGSYLKLTSKEILNKIQQEVLEFEPGTDRRYSNLGYQLVFHIISTASGKSYAQYLQDTFFTPLGMSNSGAHFYSHNLERYAYGHIQKKDSIIALTNYQEDEFKIGNLYATVDDLLMFTNYLKTLPFKQELIKDNRISHAGGTEGKRAYIQHHMNKHYTIIFLANIEELPMQHMIKDIEAILDQKPVKMPKAVHRKAIAVDTSILKRYVGTYDFAEINHIQLTFTIENNQLVCYQDNKLTGTFKAENDSTFFENPTSSESIQFIKNEEHSYTAYMDWKGMRWKGTFIPRQ